MNITYKRDCNSNALINTDDEGLAAYKTRRQRLEKIEELETDINNIKTDIADIKLLLQQILQGK